MLWKLRSFDSQLWSYKKILLRHARQDSMSSARLRTASLRTLRQQHLSLCLQSSKAASPHSFPLGSISFPFSAISLSWPWFSPPTQGWSLAPPSDISCFHPFSAPRLFFQKPGILFVIILPAPPLVTLFFSLYQNVKGSWGPDQGGGWGGGSSICTFCQRALQSLGEGA